MQRGKWAKCLPARAEPRIISLVLLTTRSPSTLGDQLTLAGDRVFEAPAISEVLYLQEQENIDAVIIDSTVAEKAEKARQLRGIAMTLNAGASVAEVQWELSLLFPNGNCSLQ